MSSHSLGTGFQTCVLAREGRLRNSIACVRRLARFGCLSTRHRPSVLPIAHYPMALWVRRLAPSHGVQLPDFIGS